MTERDIINITPETTGVEEVQKQSEKLLPVKSELSSSEGFSVPPLADVIKNLSDVGVRGMAGIALLCASVRMVESNSTLMRQERDKATSDAEGWKDKCHNEEIRCARLSERLISAGRMKVIQNILLSLGCIMGGLSAKFLIDGNNNWAMFLLIISVALLLLGWLWPTQKVEEKK